jgi:hypothetical protein
MQKLQVMALGLIITASLSACSTMSELGAKPWERGILAKPEMQVNAMDQAFDDHIYFSKEAASGGQGFAAGGCGCN